MIPAPREVPMLVTPSLASMRVSGHRLAFGASNSSGVIRTIKGSRWPLLMLEAATAMVGLARFLVADVHHGGRQGRGNRGRRGGRGLRRRHCRRRRRYPRFVFEMGGLRCRGGGGGFPGASGVCGGGIVDVHDPRSFGRRGHGRTCRHFAAPWPPQRELALRVLLRPLP